MYKAVLTGINQIEVRDFDIPELKKKDDVLLKISHVGVCGSDMHYYKEGKIGEQVVYYPFTIGHECSATVAALGAGVADLTSGQRVFVEPSIACLACPQCLTGREHTCLNVQFLGAAGQLSGALAEYIVMPRRNCFPLPDNIDLAAGNPDRTFKYRLSCCALYGEIKILSRMWRVLGAGPIGLSVLAVLKAVRRVHAYVTDKLDYGWILLKKKERTGQAIR